MEKARREPVGDCSHLLVHLLVLSTRAIRTSSSCNFETWKLSNLSHKASFFVSYASILHKVTSYT